MKYDCLIFIVCIVLESCAQELPAKKNVDLDSNKIEIREKDTLPLILKYKEIVNGIWYCETDAPFRSILGDSKLTILKINPRNVKASLHCATNEGRKSKTVVEWADSNLYQIVFNASMYDLKRPLTSRGLLIDKGHKNQSMLLEAFNSMIVLDPKDSAANNIGIIDVKNQYPTIKRNYQSFAQGLRMIDNLGEAMIWKKREQSCSMLVCAQDADSNFYLIFTRSPYTHNTMIQFLKQFPENLHNAIYMEGGPETSVYVNLPNFHLELIGSFVSNTFENDTNHEFWKLPNVLVLDWIDR